ncbi:MAG: hypothetical protein ACC628_03315 [Pirellulaceae bacterium]
MLTDWLLSYWQEGIAFLFVLGAAAYVAWRFGAAAFRPDRNGCGGCRRCSGEHSSRQPPPLLRENPNGQRREGRSTASNTSTTRKRASE